MHEGNSMLLLVASGLRTEPLLIDLSPNGLLFSLSLNCKSLSPKGDDLSLFGVLHNGVVFPLRPPIDSREPLVL